MIGILITANQPFSGWDNVFPDPGMTVAAIDRLVHHSTIFELHKGESYRGKEAARQQKIQRDNDNAQRRRQSSKDNPVCSHLLGLHQRQESCQQRGGAGRTTGDV